MRSSVVKQNKRKIENVRCLSSVSPIYENFVERVSTGRTYIKGVAATNEHKFGGNLQDSVLRSGFDGTLKKRYKNVIRKLGNTFFSFLR